jgi:hypothetical protein
VAWQPGLAQGIGRHVAAHTQSLRAAARRRGNPFLYVVESFIDSYLSDFDQASDPHSAAQHQICPSNRHSFRDNSDISDKKAIKGFCQKNCLKIWLDFKAD